MSIVGQVSDVTPWPLLYSLVIVKINLGAKMHAIKLGTVSSSTVNLVSSVEYHHPTLMIMNDSHVVSLL